MLKFIIDNKQQEVFGVVSRPPTVNPKFRDVIERVEQTAPDQTNDTSSDIASHIVASFENERRLMKLARERHPKIDNTTEVILPEQKSSIMPKNSSAIIPQLELVNNQTILEILARLHGGLLTKNLVPNPMTELHFIISLITYNFKSQPKQIEKHHETLQELKETLGCTDIIDDTSDDDNDNSKENKNEDKSSTDGINKNNELDDKQYFSTVHNCVYYATTVLVHGKKILTVLDRAALKLLCENILLTTFQPTLPKYLNQLYEAKFLQSKNFKPFNDSR